MNNIFWCILLICLTGITCNSQNLSAEALVAAWKTSDKTQTLKAEATYLDLKTNKNLNSFYSLIGQLKKDEQENPNNRLFIRLKMYELLGRYELGLPVAANNEILTWIKKCYLLGDKQLLSELYTLYAERGPINNEDKLFYNSKALEIQESIGIQYFPKIHLRYYNVSRVHYNWNNYNESIAYGKKTLKLLTDPKTQLEYYFFQYDLLGQSYYKIKQADSGIYYYSKIKESINHNKAEVENLESYPFYDKYFIEVWDGIASGGIAQGLIGKKCYEKAIPLLEENLQTSSKHEQWDDVAKAQNLMGKIHLHAGETNKAIKLWQQALINCKTYISSVTKIDIAKNLSNAYLSTKKFDSAYYYSEIYNKLSNISLDVINKEKLSVVQSRLQHEKMQNTINEAQTTINKQKTTRNLILVIVFLLFIVMIGFYIFKTKDQKRKVEIKDLEILNSNQALKNAQNQLKQLALKIKDSNNIIQQLQNQQENQQLLQELKSSLILTKEDWQNYQKLFDEAYPVFIIHLKANYPELTQAEIRQLCLEKQYLTTSEIASTLGISENSVMVTRHRIRKKLDLENQKQLQEFVNGIN